MKHVYLDHAATSPVHPEVIQVMMTSFENIHGNPSSIHRFGRESRKQLDDAREFLAKTISANADEIIFTSGGTEADNLACIGIAHANQDRGRHIISTTIEHHAVLHALHQLEKQGYDVTYLPVDENGLVDVNDVKQHLRDETILVSIMFGNNEVGSIQPMKEIGELLANHQAYFHTDAVQAYGMIDIDVKKLNLDLLSVSSHKINGPKGTGFLYVRKGTKLLPLQYGGEQERKRRAGTENVTGIMGLHKAAVISMETQNHRIEKYNNFKQVFRKVLQDNRIDFKINAENAETLPHILNLYFPGINIESFLVNLDIEGIAASSGSACTAGSIDPSHVLVAMFGKNADEIRSSIRFSFGLGNTEEEILLVAEKVVKLVKRLRNL